jgi:hypothetical protein
MKSAGNWKRYDYLLIGMICAIIVLLAIAGMASAQDYDDFTNDSATTGVYVTVAGQGAGYDPAFGLRVDHTTAARICQMGLS